MNTTCRSSLEESSRSQGDRDRSLLWEDGALIGSVTWYVRDPDRIRAGRDAPFNKIETSNIMFERPSFRGERARYRLVRSRPRRDLTPSTRAFAPPERASAPVRKWGSSTTLPSLDRSSAAAVSVPRAQAARCPVTSGLHPEREVVVKEFCAQRSGPGRTRKSKRAALGGPFEFVTGLSSEPDPRTTHYDV